MRKLDVVYSSKYHLSPAPSKLFYYFPPQCSATCITVFSHIFPLPLCKSVGRSGQPAAFTRDHTNTARDVRKPFINGDDINVQDDLKLITGKPFIALRCTIIQSKQHIKIKIKTP